MYAKPVLELPEGSEWQYEIKFDGYRCLKSRQIDTARDRPIVLNEN